MQRRRQFFVDGSDKGFDEDDDYWARTLNNWAEESGTPVLDDARKLAGGLLAEAAKRVAGEDPRKVKELVRETAIREDRRLGPKELDNVAAWAAAARTLIGTELDAMQELKGPERTKARNALKPRLSFLGGDEVNLKEADSEWVAKLIEAGPGAAAALDKTRQIGAGLLREVVEQGTSADKAELRELANDLCLRTDGKMSRDDIRVVEAVGAEGARHLQRHAGPAQGRGRPRQGCRRPAGSHLDQVQGARGTGDRRRRGPVPRAARPVRQLVGLR